MKKLKSEVKRYLQYLEDQSPIISDSHFLLQTLYDKYGKSNVSNEIQKQLKKG